MPTMILIVLAAKKASSAIAGQGAVAARNVAHIQYATTPLHPIRVRIHAPPHLEPSKPTELSAALATRRMPPYGRLHGLLGWRDPKPGALMSSLRLTFACGPFDRTQALRDGTVKPEGIDLIYLAMQPAEIFWRMLQYNEFDISEMSLANYSMLVAKGNAPFLAIPAFPSRVFRH